MPLTQLTVPEGHALAGDTTHQLDPLAIISPNRESIHQKISQKQARFLVNQKAIDFIGSDLHQPKDLKDMARLLYSNELQLLHNLPLLNSSLL